MIITSREMFAVAPCLGSSSLAPCPTINYNLLGPGGDYVNSAWIPFASALLGLA